jgi:hypothetical protein
MAGYRRGWLVVTRGRFGTTAALLHGIRWLLENRLVWVGADVRRGGIVAYGFWFCKPVQVAWCQSTAVKHGSCIDYSRGGCERKKRGLPWEFVRVEGPIVCHDSSINLRCGYGGCPIGGRERWARAAQDTRE